MIKVPNDNQQFSQPNNSDRSGNIYMTKNVNFDEKGYVKLSPRTVRLYSEEDGGNFDLPLSLGRYEEGKFRIITADKAYNTNLSQDTTALVSQDTGTNTPNPAAFNSWGRWWQNRWYVTTDTGLLYQTQSSGNWTDTGISLTTGVTHVLEVFKNKNYLAVANGNTVRLYDTSHALQLTLTIPAGYEVIGLSFSNNLMAVITMSAATVSQQNQEAFLFMWDGSTTEANQAYAVGSDMIAAVCPYKSSWAILTRAGQLKYFNGGGLQDLDALPFYYRSLIWSGSGSRTIYGDGMVADGDKLLINISTLLNQFNEKGEVYLSNYPGGILCYDPAVGIYNRYSPSVSPVSLVRVLDSGVNTTTNIMTITSGTIPTTGNPAKYVYNPSGVIGGLQIGKVYYVIRIDASSFKLALTKDDAIAGNAVDLTSIGSASNSFLMLNVVDYGISLSGDTGGIGLFGKTSRLYQHLLFGGDCDDITSASNTYATLCAPINGFKNIGYFVIPKPFSEGMEDNFQKIFIKHRPLEDGSEIIVKAKTEDIIGLPVTTPQVIGTSGCAWTSSTVFTTTNNISEAYSYLQTDGNELECEIISGAGAGQLSQIASITYNAGTYTVTLEDAIDGAASSRYCDVKIDNFSYVGTIDDTNEKGWQEFLVGEQSKWAMFKVILSGANIDIEQTMINNQVYKPN